MTRRAAARVAYARVAFDARVVAANPAELTAILLDELVGALTAARAATAVGRLSDRSAALTRSLTVLTLLTRGLDHMRGGTAAAAFDRWCEQLSAAVLARTLRWDAAAFDDLVTDAREMSQVWGCVRLMAATGESDDAMATAATVPGSD